MPGRRAALLPSETRDHRVRRGDRRVGPTRGSSCSCCARRVGAFAGDNLSYLIGWRFGPWATRRFFSGEKGAARRDWAERSLHRFGMGLIIVCRFIPGGRTAVTLSCGLDQVLVAAVRRRHRDRGGLWASYAFFAGRIGGKAFEDKPLVGFAVAFGGGAGGERARRGDQAAHRVAETETLRA